MVDGFGVGNFEIEFSSFCKKKAVKNIAVLLALGFLKLGDKLRVVFRYFSKQSCADRGRKIDVFKVDIPNTSLFEFF